MIKIDKIKSKFTDKKLLFAFWRATGETQHQHYYLILKKMFKKIIVFDTERNYFFYGKDLMRERLLETIRKEKPDYIFFLLLYDEIDPLTLIEIKKISPGTKILNLFGDDDWRFEDFSRYYIPFLDYAFVHHNVIDKYRKDGFRNVFFTLAMNTELFRPLNLRKEYDVTFFGGPSEYRTNFLKFLIKKGINVKVFGRGWATYHELEKYYGGYLNAEKLIDIINKTKIIIGFSHGGYGNLQVKGRFFEVAACKSFALIEHTSKYYKFFKKDDEIVMFSGKESLLKKINYYLTHDDEREKIANNAYKKVLKNHNQQIKLKEFFLKVDRIETKKRLNVNLKNKVLSLNINDFKCSLEETKEKIEKEKTHYISLDIGSFKRHPLQYYIQTYSLKKSGKNISCCDYYVSSRKLKKYLLFKAKYTFTFKKFFFKKLITPVQLMFTKKYFLENITQILTSINNKEFGFINDDNTSFVSIPLVEIYELPKLKGDIIQDVYQMKFLDKLFSLYCQKKLFKSSYIYKLMLESLNNKFFIIRSLTNSVLDKGKISRMKKY